MFIVFQSISIVSIFVALAANMVVGMFWYSSQGFGETWTTLVGLTNEKIQKNGPQKALTGWLITALFTVLSLAILFALVDVRTVFEGVVLAVLVWFGFIAMNQIGHALFDGRSWKLVGIYLAQEFVNFILMGAILAAWR